MSWFAIAFKPFTASTNISLAASKIAPLFKSGKYKDGSGNVLPYRFFEPSPQSRADKKLPVILYLHGENERGTDNEIQLVTTECATIWAEPDHLAKNPVYVLAPQTPKGSDWNSESVYSNALSLLKQMQTCAKGLVDGSITGTPFCRTIGGMPTLSNIATVGQASAIYNLNNIHTIKGALRSLKTSTGNLSPRFAPYTAFYSVLVDTKLSNIMITPAVLSESYESMTINGDKITSGSEYIANLPKDINEFSIAVTSSDKKTRTYKLTISKAN